MGLPRLRRTQFLTAALLTLLTGPSGLSIPSEPSDHLLNQESLLLPVKAVIFSKDIRLRASPSTDNAKVVDVLPFGTPVTIVERSKEKVSLMNHSGHWFRVTTSSNKEGWVFGKFLVSEQAPELRDETDKILKGLWFSRPQLPVVVKQMKTTPYNKVKEALTHVKPTALNYIAYHLLAEQNANALPVLIEFMSPQNKGQNAKDPNYSLNWEILSRLAPNQLIEPTYDAFTKFWQEKGSSYTFPMSRADVFALLVRVKQAEDKTFRH
jgi:hypothetical protein